VIPNLAGSDRTCSSLVAKHLILCLSEPRATRLAHHLAPWDLHCLRLQLHCLQACGPSAGNALRIMELSSSSDVLLPVSPGAVEMLHQGLRGMLPGHCLEGQAWLCVGPGTREEVERHDPKATCYLPAEGSRDLATLLGQPAVQAWVGHRKVHLFCSQARASEALGRLPEWIRAATLVYPVYAETWHPLTREVLERLFWILLEAGDRCLASHPRWEGYLAGVQTADEAGAGAGVDVFVLARVARILEVVGQAARGEAAMQRCRRGLERRSAWRSEFLRAYFDTLGHLPSGWSPQRPAVAVPGRDKGNVGGGATTQDS